MPKGETKSSSQRPEKGGRGGTFGERRKRSGTFGAQRLQQSLSSKREKSRFEKSSRTLFGKIGEPTLTKKRSCVAIRGELQKGRALQITDDAQKRNAAEGWYIEESPWRLRFGPTTRVAEKTLGGDNRQRQVLFSIRREQAANESRGFKQIEN